MGAEVLERYRIAATLHRGRMGVVYRAEQRMGTFSRPVAIRVLPESHVRDRSVRARILRECEAGVRLEHANTARLYDFGWLPDGSLAIVMEYVEGELLGDLLTRGAVPVDRALPIVGQICASLHEAHSRGIVHRDLQPDRVSLTHVADQRDVVKVLDLGFAAHRPAATASNTAATSPGTPLGTLRYMSPEQLRGREIDGRSNIYSLAVMTYEMLTGESPFASAAPADERAERLLRSAPIPIDVHSVAAALSSEARAVLMQALAEDPGRRPPSVLGFAHDLTGGRPLDPRPGLGSIHPASPTAGMPAHPPGARPAPPLVPASASPVATAAPRRTAPGFVALLGFLLGAAVVVLAYHALVHQDQAPVAAPSTPSSPLRAQSTKPLLPPAEADARSSTARSVEPPVAATSPVPAPIGGAATGSGPPRAWLTILHHQLRVTSATAALGSSDQRFAEIARGGRLTLQLADGTLATTDGGPGPDLLVVVSSASGPYRVEAAQAHQRFQILVSEATGTTAVDLDRLVLGTTRYIRLSARSAVPVLVDAVGVYRTASAGNDRADGDARRSPPHRSAAERHPAAPALTETTTQAPARRRALARSGAPPPNRAVTGRDSR